LLKGNNTVPATQPVAPEESENEEESDNDDDEADLLT